MHDRREEPADQAPQLPPSDVERVRVLAQLIQHRITELCSQRDERSLNRAEARELFVLEYLRDEWLLEGLGKRR